MSGAEDNLLKEMDVEKWCVGFLHKWKSEHGILYGQTADRFERVVAELDRLRAEVEDLREWKAKCSISVDDRYSVGFQPEGDDA